MKNYVKDYRIRLFLLEQEKSILYEVAYRRIGCLYMAAFSFRIKKQLLLNSDNMSPHRLRQYGIVIT